MAMRGVEDSPPAVDAPLWTRALAAEMLPDPVTQLDRELLWHGAALPAWRDLLAGRLGFRACEIAPEHGGAATELLGFFGGYAYLNVSVLRVWAARMPVLAPNHIDAAYLDELAPLPPYEAAAWHDLPEATGGPLKEWLAWVLVDQDQSVLVAEGQAVSGVRRERPDIAALSDLDVFAYVVALQPLCRRLFAQFFNQTLAASIGPGLVAAMCDEIGVPTYAIKLLAPLGGVDSVAAAQAMWTLSRLVRGSATLTRSFDVGRLGLDARLRSSETLDALAFLAGFDAVVNEVGHLGPAQFELRARSWETDPDLALAAVDWLRSCPDDADPALGLASRKAERSTAIKEVGDMVTSGQSTTAVAATAVFVRGRERSRSNLGRLLHEMRFAMRELGQRAVGRGDVDDVGDLHHLSVDELTYYADGGLADVGEITNERRRQYQRLSLSPPTLIIDGESGRRVSGPAAPQGSEPPPLEAGEVLLARPGSSDTGRGRARIVADPSQRGAFEPGDVLITAHASAGWMPYLIGIAALVVETGSVLGDAAVACRELGVAVVVAAEHATTRILDGSIVDVDGITGIVTVVEDPPMEEKRPVAKPLDPWGVVDH